MSIGDAISKIYALKVVGEYTHFKHINATDSGASHARNEGYAITEAINAAKDSPEVACLLRAASEALDAAQDAYHAFVSARDAAYELALGISDNPAFSVEIDDLEGDCNEFSRAAHILERKAQNVCDTVYNARYDAQNVEDEDEDEDEETENEAE